MDLPNNSLNNISEDDDINAPLDIRVSDLTIIEGNGQHNQIQEIMDLEEFGSEEWMLRTEMSMIFPNGMCEFVLHFYYDKRVLIMGYAPSAKDVLYAPDLRGLSTWLQDRGWQVPEPDVELIKDDRDFWKYFYDVGLIQSEYIDENFSNANTMDDEEGESELS